MGVTPAHQEADQRTLLTLALSSSDRLLLEHMYRTMLELGLDDELLELGGSALERFLATAGGADAPAESALTSQQVSEPCGSRWHPKSTVPLNEREREREMRVERARLFPPPVPPYAGVFRARPTLFF